MRTMTFTRVNVKAKCFIVLATFPFRKIYPLIMYAPSSLKLLGASMIDYSSKDQKECLLWEQR